MNNKLVAVGALLAALVVCAAASADALGRKSRHHVAGVNASNTGPDNGTDNRNGNENPIDDVNTNPTPEPLTGLLVGAGLAGAVGYRRFRKRSRANKS